MLSLYVLFVPGPSGAGLGPPGTDKVVHLLLFLLLTATARLSFGARRAVLGAGLAYAALSELVQALLLAERSGDLLDFVADAVGVLVGWQLAGRWRRTRS